MQFTQANITAKWSFKLLVVWIAFAVLAPLLANDKALLLVDENGVHFPFLNNNLTLNSNEIKFQIKAPIPYAPNSIDFENANAVSPLSEQTVSSTYYRHWLGTDQLGRDVFSSLIHGSRTAFLIGFGAMLLAALVGFLLGCIAAFTGDYNLKVPLAKLLLLCFILVILALVTLVLIPWDISSVPFSTKATQAVMTILIGAIAYWLLAKGADKFLISKTTKRVLVPVDLLIGRLIEIMESIPLLFLIVGLSVIVRPSIGSVILIIAFAAWPSIAKYTRAEVLKIRHTQYIENCKAMGLSNFSIISKHILPNAISPLLITLAFGLASAILIESSLSFLGLGISSETASWGQLLAAARQNYQAWWLALFPGFAIFLTVLSCNSLGDFLNK